MLAKLFKKTKTPWDVIVMSWTCMAFLDREYLVAFIILAVGIAIATVGEKYFE